MTLLPVASAGTRFAMTSRGTIIEPVYPPSPRGEALRVWRVRTADMTLRDGAAALGLSAVDLSDLEAGRATLSEEDWNALDKMRARLPVSPNDPDDMPSRGYDR